MDILWPDRSDASEGVCNVQYDILLRRVTLFGCRIYPILILNLFVTGLYESKNVCDLCSKMTICDAGSCNDNCVCGERDW
jgi:hypothetical protein